MSHYLWNITLLLSLGTAWAANETCCVGTAAGTSSSLSVPKICPPPSSGSAAAGQWQTTSNITCSGTKSNCIRVSCKTKVQSTEFYTLSQMCHSSADAAIKDQNALLAVSGSDVKIECMDATGTGATTSAGSWLQPTSAPLLLATLFLAASSASW